MNKINKRKAIEILQLEGQSLTEDLVKKAYRKLAKENHPDQHPNDETKCELMKNINAAYELLKGLIENDDLDNDDEYTYEYETTDNGPTVRWNKSPFSHVWYEKASQDNKPYKLLYYIDRETVDKHYEGYPIIKWNFINLENGMIVELYSSDCHKELSDMGIPCYPDHPDYLELAQYIIWERISYQEGQKSIAKINKSNTSWQNIQQEYHSLLKQSTKTEAIKLLMKKYCISKNDFHNFGVQSKVETAEDIYANDGTDFVNDDKMLLYFLYWQHNSLYPDRPLFEFWFMNIKTGIPVKLYLAKQEEKIPRGYGAPFYDADLKAWENKHYIIWRNTNSLDPRGVFGHNIYRIDTKWEDIRKEYFSGLRAGKDNFELIKNILSQYRECDNNPYDFEIDIKFKKRYY